MPPLQGPRSLLLDEIYAVAHSTDAVRYHDDTLPMRVRANALAETLPLRLCYLGMLRLSATLDVQGGIFIIWLGYTFYPQVDHLRTVLKVDM